MSRVAEKVETFLQRLHDLEYTIDPKASDISYEIPKSYGSISKELPKRSLADNLALAISNYEENRDEKHLSLAYAETCFIWINRAFTNGVVKESDSLVKKLEECTQKNAQLQKDLESVSANYMVLQNKFNQFSRIVKLPDEKSWKRRQ